MKILVCVKQVPDTSEIRIDPVTNTLIRKGVPSVVNPNDLHAVECALGLKEQYPGSTITLLSMGPFGAEAALRECLGMGCDDAYLLTDRAFAGADTYATSYSIAVAAQYLQEQKGDFDLVLCGTMAVDGDTGQVGPELAEHLGIPIITYCRGLQVEGDTVRGHRSHEVGYEVVETTLPALVTVTKDINEPRRGTVYGKIFAKRAEVTFITAADLGDRLDSSKIGLAGSPTHVRGANPPKLRTRGDDITGQTAAESAANILGKLQEIEMV